MKSVFPVNLSDVADEKVTFNNLDSLYCFAKQESEFWTNASNEYEISSEDTYVNNFNELINLIDGWKDRLETWDDDQLNKNINQHRSIFIQIENGWLWSGHPFVGAFLGCNKLYGTQGARSFIDFITNRKVNNVCNKHRLIGTLLAYEFELQDSDLTKRRNSEELSLNDLRDQLAETTQKLTSEAEEFKDNFSSWDETIKSNWKEWLSESALEYAEQKESQRNENEEQKQNQKDEFITYMGDCKARIAALEQKYEDKLRLEKPATYWKESAKKHGLQGSLWAILLTASILLGLVYFYDFFDSWLKGQAIPIRLNTLQGAVIFGSMLAVYAFFVKTISKFTFSSFHLMRDSEEREQLTYLYLSLNNDSQIDQSSRELILQALFSRSETGLLTGESGPTMPVHDLLKTVLKGK